jgi:hypothetical protein
MTLIKGELEIDEERGVIYFHANKGQSRLPTPLRICRLPKPIPNVKSDEFEGLDITHMHGVNWRSKEK